MIDEARSNHSRILAWAARVSEVFDRPETLFRRHEAHDVDCVKQSRMACSSAFLVSVSVHCLFCKSVFGTCALGLRRKEHLLSPPTSSVVCLPLHVPDVEPLGNIFQPHYEVGGGSRHTFSSQRSFRIVSDAVLIFLHILVAAW